MHEATITEEFFNDSLFKPSVCFFSGYKTNATYPITTFKLRVAINQSDGQSFEMKTNLNEFIHKLKETIGKRIGYRCDQQRLRLVLDPKINVELKLKDGYKLGDYMNSTNVTSISILRVYKRLGNNHVQFNSTPNVTHYEYAKMSSHTYQPDEDFLHDWQVFPSHIFNRNGLAYTAYYNAERHQYVIAIRGTELQSGFWYNPMTDLRLVFTDQIIDTLDSARVSIFYDNPLHISRNDSIPVVISFTGHSLGAALAESLACTYHAYAVTFDSPGTKHILSKDPLCQMNMNLGYNPKVYVQTYLGPYANLVNVARPQFGQIKYLIQFADDIGPDQFYYIFSSATCVFAAVCIMRSVISKRWSQFGVFLSIGYFIVKNIITRPIEHFYNFDSKTFGGISSYIVYLPFIIMILIPYHSISTLADLIERGTNELISQIPRNNILFQHTVIIRIQRSVNSNGVINRFVLLSIPVILSILIHLGIPLYLYMWWLHLIHTMDNFVLSFNSYTGEPYEAQLIDSELWPRLSDYVTKIFLTQFLQVFSIIECMKLVSYYLLPLHRRWHRQNLILLAFCFFFNIGSWEQLYSLFIGLLVGIVLASHKENQHYIRNLRCVTCGLLATNEILRESHKMDHIYVEVMSYLLILVLYVRRSI